MKSLSDIRNKRVLYVGTKNSDYLRLTQEIRLLREQGNEVTVIASPEKSYLKRLCRSTMRTSRKPTRCATVSTTRPLRSLSATTSV